MADYDDIPTTRLVEIAMENPPSPTVTSALCRRVAHVRGLAIDAALNVAAKGRKRAPADVVQLIDMTDGEYTSTFDLDALR